jgi:hypothetical protein
LGRGGGGLRWLLLLFLMLLHGIRLRIGEIESGVVLKWEKRERRTRRTGGRGGRQKSHYKKGMSREM